MWSHNLYFFTSPYKCIFFPIFPKSEQKFRQIFQDEVILLVSHIFRDACELFLMIFFLQSHSLSVKKYNKFQFQLLLEIR